MAKPCVTIGLSSGEILYSSVNTVDLMGAFLDFYVEHPVETIPKDFFDDVKLLISLGALYMAFMPDDGFFAWTLSLPESFRKVFAAFDASTRSFVARSHLWQPDAYEKTPRLALQSVSQRLNLNAVSTFDCIEKLSSGDTIRHLFEKHLHDNGFSDYRIEATGEELRLKYSGEDAGECDDMFRIPLTFRCGCTKERVASVFSGISKADRDFLFEKSKTVTVECPRCGMKYELRKNEIK
ncbi:Hsp33 family molecular chaperone HslO [bacterium]|nr:Hsp33 family molecular chaperone HslO [bacterium]